MNYLNPIEKRLVLNPLFRDPFKDFEELFGAWFDADAPAEKGTRRPALDWYDADDSLVARADMPGLKPDEIVIESADGRIELKGDRKTKTADGKGDATIAYRVSFAVPENVDASKATARYEDGVLSLALPKAEKAKPRRIAIETK